MKKSGLICLVLALTSACRAEPTPEFVLKDDGIYFNGSALRLGQSMAQWRTVLKGEPRCSEEKPAPLQCVWDALGLSVGSYGGAKAAVAYLNVQINLAEKDPDAALFTTLPDGSPAAKGEDWGPKQAFGGRLELDGVAIGAGTRFSDIRKAVKPQRHLSCGLRDCTVAQGTLGKQMTLYFRLKTGSESSVINRFSVSSGAAGVPGEPPR